MTKNAVVEKWCQYVDAAINELAAEVDRLQAQVDELLAQHEADVAREWDGRGMSRDEIALRLLVGMAADENDWAYGTVGQPRNPWPDAVQNAYQGADAFLAAVAEKKTK